MRGQEVRAYVLRSKKGEDPSPTSTAMVATGGLLVTMTPGEVAHASTPHLYSWHACFPEGSRQIEPSVLLLSGWVVQLFLDVFPPALSRAPPGQYLGEP